MQFEIIESLKDLHIEKKFGPSVYLYKNLQNIKFNEINEIRVFLQFNKIKFEIQKEKSLQDNMDDF